MTIVGGTETRVNTYVAGDQTWQQATALADGGWVVTWSSEDQDGGWYPYYGVYQQVYNADGTARGGEVHVNSYTYGNQNTSRITTLSDGGWVVTWKSDGGQDGSGSGVYQQAFNANGTVRGGEVRVNTYYLGDQASSQIAALGNGGWVVTWLSPSGVYQQCYNADGSAHGGEVQVSAQANDESSPKIMALPEGGWVVVWTGTGRIYQHAYNADGTDRSDDVQVNTGINSSLPQTTALDGGGWVVTWTANVADGSYHGIYQRAFNADGTARGGEVLVNTQVYGDQYSSQITALADGGWVVTWRSSFQDSPGDWGVYQQAYNADGTVRGGEVRVNNYVADNQWEQQITALADGGWVVTWSSEGQDGSGYGVYQQAYNSDGSANGVETKVNTFVEGNQSSPQVTALADGGWVVTWTSRGQDGSGSGVYQRVFHSSHAPSGADKSIDINEDGSHNFAVGDFGFNDSDHNNFSAVIITTLPVSGALTLNGDAVSVGQLISVGDLGNLVWTPNADAHGIGLASFTFQVVDDGGSANTDLSPNTISFNVTNVNDGPAVINAVADQSSPEDQAWSFQIPTNAFSDADGDALTYSASLGNGSVLPAWLTFNAATRTFSGTPPHNFNGALDLKVTASDGSLSTSDTFRLSITIPNDFNGGPGNDKFSFNFKLTDATVSFSGNHVIVDGPSGSHTVLTGVDTFVFTDGTVNDNDGDPLVNDLFYYSHNRDVWNAHVDADQHYHQNGWHEGRDPSGFFSTSFYLSLNQDVKQAGVDPLAHFHQFGWQEGRQPSAAFDDAGYLAANPDVAAARVDPLAHFLQFGQDEGRQATSLTSLIGPHGFDSVYYLQHNPDVQAAEIDPFQHYQNFGWKEGRNPNALFDSKGYLTANPDVANAHVNPLDHYDQFGWREGRDPSTAFDTTEYLSHYSDVAAAHIDPLVHYLQHGIHEGRQTFADGLWV